MDYREHWDVTYIILQKAVNEMECGILRDVVLLICSITAGARWGLLAT